MKVIGTDGDWLKVILPEKVGYVYSGYMTVSDGEAGSGEGSFSLNTETLENLLGMLGGGLNGGAALTPDGNLSLIDDITKVLYADRASGLLQWKRRTAMCSISLSTVTTRARKPCIF